MMPDTIREEPPALDAGAMVLSAILVSLEERLPGISDSCVRHIEDDALHAEVRRIGCAAPDPSIVAEGRKAVAILRALRFVTLAQVARRKRKERG